MNLVKLEEIASLTLFFAMMIIVVYFVIGRVTVRLMLEYNAGRTITRYQPGLTYDSVSSIV